VSALALVATPLGMRTLGVGLFLVVLALGLAFFRRRRLIQGIDRIQTLATDGHAQEARVLARASGGWAKPLVDALAGDRPDNRAHAVGLDIVFAAIAAVAAIQGPLSIIAMRSSAPTSSMATDAGALLASMGLLAPLVLVAVALIVRLGISARRRVRGACVAILVFQMNAPAPSRSRKEQR